MDAAERGEEYIPPPAAVDDEPPKPAVNKLARRDNIPERSRSRERDIPERSRSRSRERDIDDSNASFIPAAAFSGRRRGFVFKRGPEGIGYYRDAGSTANAIANEEETYRAALNDNGAAATDDSPDAPILAALGSHRSGLEAAESACARLEAEAKHGSSSGLRHEAEKLEVRLTDQLMQLTTMLDDCVTADGRAAVKALVAKLKGLGARLLRVSQGR